MNVKEVQLIHTYTLLTEADQKPQKL